MYLSSAFCVALSDLASFGATRRAAAVSTRVLAPLHAFAALGFGSAAALPATAASEDARSRSLSIRSATRPPEAARGAHHGADVAQASHARPSPGLDIKKLAAGIRDGERGAVSRGITLAESSNVRHTQLFEALMEDLEHGVASSQALEGRHRGALRVGVSGPPGVGKSCFIEQLGLRLVEQGHRVAVLAVDPSSPDTRGSLLADKTRMARLQAHPAAFVRPSASCGELGGVRRATAEAIAIVEAAGFDRVLVESVGVGQSEIAVSQLTDCLLLLLPPVGGDSLQAAKKGIMEAADLVIVTKADGELRPLADQAAAELKAALSHVRPRWQTVRQHVLTCSSLTESDGIRQAAEWIADFFGAIAASGELAAHRQRQLRLALESELHFKLLQAFQESEVARRAVASRCVDVCNGVLSHRRAADEVLRAFWRDAAARLASH